MGWVWDSERGTITHLPPQRGTEDGPPGARTGISAGRLIRSEQLLLPSGLLTLSVSSAVVSVITGGFSENVTPLFDQVLGSQWRTSQNTLISSSLWGGGDTASADLQSLSPRNLGLRMIDQRMSSFLWLSLGHHSDCVLDSLCERLWETLKISSIASGGGEYTIMIRQEQ